MDRPDPGRQRIQERKTTKIDLVAGACNHMVGFHRSKCTVSIGQLEVYPAIVLVRFLQCQTEVEAHVADHLVLHKPSRGRPKMPSDHFQSKPLRQLAENQWSTGTEQRTPTRPQTRHRILNPLQPRPRNSPRWLMEPNHRLSRHQLNHSP